MCVLAYKHSLTSQASQKTYANKAFSSHLGGMLLLTPPSAGFYNDCNQFKEWLPTAYSATLPFHAHTHRRETHIAPSLQMRLRKGFQLSKQQLNVLPDTRVCEFKLLNAFKKHNLHNLSLPLPFPFSPLLSSFSPPPLCFSLAPTTHIPSLTFHFAACMQSLSSTKLLHFKTTMTTL